MRVLGRATLQTARLHKHHGFLYAGAIESQAAPAFSGGPLEPLGRKRRCSNGKLKRLAFSGRLLSYNQAGTENDKGALCLMGDYRTLLAKA